MAKYKFTAFQKKWLKALESGKYHQTKGVLFNGKGYCCLGVACRLAGIKPEIDDGDYRFNGEIEEAPPSIVRALKLRSSLGTIKWADNEDAWTEGLATMNDARKKFKTIAKFIRANPEKVFLP